MNDIMYTNTTDVLNLIKEISMKVDFSDLYDLVLRIPNQYLQFYDGKRLYKKGELFHVENIKYLVLKDVTVANVDMKTLEYFQPVQTKMIHDWVYGEYIQKGMKRISLENGLVYEATVFIKQAIIDPALTTDGKWSLITTEV